MSNTKDLIIAYLQTNNAATAEEISKDISSQLTDILEPRKAVGIQLGRMRSNGEALDNGDGTWSLGKISDDQNHRPPKKTGVQVATSPHLMMTETGKTALSELQKGREPFEVVIMSSPITIQNAQAIYLCIGEECIELDPRSTLFETGPETPEWNSSQVTNRKTNKIKVVKQNGDTIEVQVPPGYPVTRREITE